MGDFESFGDGYHRGFITHKQMSKLQKNILSITELLYLLKLVFTTNGVQSSSRFTDFKRRGSTQLRAKASIK